MTSPSSHAKGTVPQGNIKAQAASPKFQQATSGAQPEAAKGQVKPVKPEPAQNHQMKGPGGQSVTNAHNQQRMDAYHSQEREAHIKQLKQNANNGHAREQAQKNAKLQSKDDLQK